MRYKVGDKVVIVKTISSEYKIIWNVQGMTDKWCGKTMTIRERIKTSKLEIYKMNEDLGENCGIGWTWYDFMIDHETTKKLQDEQKQKDVRSIISKWSDWKKECATSLFGVDFTNIKED